MPLLHALVLVLSFQATAPRTPEERAAEETLRQARHKQQAEEFRQGWERAEIGLREEIRERIRTGTLDGLWQSVAERRFDLPGAFQSALFADLDRAFSLQDPEGRAAALAHAAELHELALPGLRRVALDDCGESEFVRHRLAREAADCAMRLGDWGSAIELLTIAAGIFPAEWPIAESARELRKCVEELAPRKDDPEVWLEFVDAYWLGTGQRPRDAEETLLQVRARFAEGLSPALCTRLDRTIFACRLQQGDLHGAENWIAAIAAGAPSNRELEVQCRLSIADAYAGRCAYDLAAARYRAILAEHPDSNLWDDAQFQLASMLVERGDIEGAIRGLEEVLARNAPARAPGRSAMQTHLNGSHRAADRISACYARLGDIEQALVYARRARAIPFVSFCGTCEESEAESDKARVERLALLLRKR